MLTSGLLVAFLGMIAAALVERRRIAEALRESGFGRSAVIMLAIAIAVFLFMELALVHPTQQLYFDDVIYQAMAQQLIHSGQAWFCDYGTPTACFTGELFHEPIGESFNLALAFLVLGVNRDAAFDMQVLLGAGSVLFLFLSSLLLFRDRIAAFFSSLIMAIEPVLLMWARPTNSDLATLTYSLVALFFVLVFSRKKSVWTLALAATSIALVTYMKVDAVAYIVLLPLIYLLVDGNSIIGSFRSNLRLAYNSFLDTGVLIVLLVFVIAVAPEIIYTQQQLGGGFGYQGTYIQNTCSPNSPPTQVVGAINLQNLMLNVCGNAYFWFDNYADVPGYPMPQPVPLTLMAILGVIAMLASGRSRRILLALGIWFLFFFILYSAFYAGSVTYGVDWRFQLGMIAQTSMFGGFFASFLVDTAGKLRGDSSPKEDGHGRPATESGPAVQLARRRAQEEKAMPKQRRREEALLSRRPSEAQRGTIIAKNPDVYEKLIATNEAEERAMPSKTVVRGTANSGRPGPLQLVTVIIIIAVLAYSAYAEAPGVGIPASQISQAQPARFYEGFVYNESSKIPNTCLVLSYDPTIFNLVGKTAAQMFELNNPQMYQQFKQQYPCLVLDWGYWCTTPNNLCVPIRNSYNLQPIALGTDNFQGQSFTFGFYLLNGTRKGAGTAPTVNVSAPSIIGLNVTLNGAATNVSQISWSWGDGYTNTGPFPQSHTYQAGGCYDILVNVTSTSGQTASASRRVCVPGAIDTTTILGSPVNGS